MGLLGLVGQRGYNFASSFSKDESPRGPFIQRLADSRWIPLRILSDARYEKMLTEKLLRAEVEISLLDEKIAALHAARPAQKHNEDGKN